MLLGCIGDDFTGSSDLANTLAKGGLGVTQYCGVPRAPAAASVEAGIVALKSRTIDPAEAVAQSLAAAHWLIEQGCRQFLFKYCSTFDSTPEGNIGPVIDALMEKLSADRTIVCPAFPAAGRTIFKGHLFVGDRLLSESGMENHPLTPMTDADLRRWLKPQTKHAVGHVGFDTVGLGADAIEAAIEAEVASGRPVVVVDAIDDAGLVAIGRAARDFRLITGGSGIALALPENLRAGTAAASRYAGWTGAGKSPAAILSGSCSAMTRAQVARYAAHYPSFEVVPDDLMAGSVSAEAAAAYVLEHAGDAALVYTSAEPERVRAAQARFGRAAVAEAIEAFFAEVARRLVAAGVRRLVVAGGETSGAVVEGLKLPALEIGPEIAAGVPAVKAADRPLWLALKSGNFGAEDFFETSLRALSGEASST